MEEIFKYPENGSLENKIDMGDGHILTSLSLLGVAGEYHSLTIVDMKKYEADKVNRNVQVRAMVISMDLEEMEKIGKLLLERVKQVKLERKKAI